MHMFQHSPTQKLRTIFLLITRAKYLKYTYEQYSKTTLKLTHIYFTSTFNQKLDVQIIKDS